MALAGQNTRNRTAQRLPAVPLHRASQAVSQRLANFVRLTPSATHLSGQERRLHPAALQQIIHATQQRLIMLTIVLIAHRRWATEDGPPSACSSPTGARKAWAQQWSCRLYDTDSAMMTEFSRA